MKKPEGVWHKRYPTPFPTPKILKGVPGEEPNTVKELERSLFTEGGDQFSMEPVVEDLEVTT